MSAFVILDAGTGGGKCVIFDEHGQILGAAREPWTYDLELDPEISFVKRFSFDAEAFWQRLCACVRRALAEAQLAPADVSGVAATSQREGCVFLDAGGNEVYAGPNIDARGFREAMDVLSTLGNERLYAITGHSAPFIFPLARYLWYRNHGGVPVAHLLMINDWLTWRLSGELTAEPSNAVESMLFDLQARAWSQEILSTFDIPAHILAPLRRCGEHIGSITVAAARETGLAAGTPVFVGGADTQCSLLGAGVFHPGEAAVTLGTTSPVQMVLDRPTFDPAASLWAGCHVVPDRWVLESNAGDTGDAYLWVLDLVSGGAADRERLYQLGEELGAGAPATDSMLFAGPTIFNLTKMRLNRPGGWLFPFPSFHVRPDRGVLVRSFLESIGYAVRANLEQLTAVTGKPVHELTLSGGLSRSAVLTKIIADISGLQVRVGGEPESASLGCAILIAANDHGNYAAAANAMVRHRHLAPDPELHASYDAAYRKWCELENQLGDLEV